MPSDVLSDVLRSLRVSGTVYFCEQMAPPWRKDFNDMASASFHYVRRGGCWAVSADRTEYLGPGDLIFVGFGRDHLLASQPPGRASSENDTGALLLCGYCEIADEGDAPLREIFPSLSIIRDAEIQMRPWLKGTLDQLSSEYLAQQPGAELVVNKLTEVLLVELIRVNFGRSDQSQLLRALSDKHIAKALQRLHSHPETNWTLENMASDIGLSRAGFAKRFKTLVGLPMFDYLTRLRMQRAKELLRDTQLPMHEIASRVGYESDLAFTKTFNKRTGTTPTRYRKQEGHDHNDRVT